MIFPLVNLYKVHTCFKSEKKVNIIVNLEPKKVNNRNKTSTTKNKQNKKKEREEAVGLVNLTVFKNP